MPSHLRLESSFEPIVVSATYQHTLPIASSPPTKRAKTNKMTLTQTYYIASTARSKLGREAARADHNLRRLVGHANMLDQLMVELSQAEQEQEAWFNASVRTAAAQSDEPRRVQWIDTIAEANEADEEDDDEVYDEDSDVESEFDETEMFNIPLRRLKSPPVGLGSTSYDDEEDYEEFEDDEEEIIEQPSQPSPPELTYDDSDSEDELPASPRNASLELSDKDRQAIASTSYFADSETAIVSKDYALAGPQRQPVIAAC